MASVNDVAPSPKSSGDSADKVVNIEPCDMNQETDPETEAYFTSYDDLEVHKLMLRDRPRTLAYKNFIEKNAQLFQDKVVIDVGAGTGILSMFAAKAGARQVYAIEASQISKVCEHLIVHNDLQDKVKVIHGRVEDVSLPDGVRADVIISEWMGFYLVHESMLSSVIAARDRWLKSDGLLLPSAASLYVCPVSMKQHHKDNFVFWQDVYGFDFSPVLPAVKARQMSEPVITSLTSDQCLAPAELVTHLDLLYLGMDELESITGSFSFKSAKNDVLHGFACWFDVEFEGESPVKLSTGPEAEATHWKQTVVMLPYPLLVCKEEEISCTLSLTKDPKRPRWYNISIEVPDDTSDSASASDDGAEDNVNDEIQDLLMDAMENN